MDAINQDGTLRMLDDVVDERRVKLRDCRDCKNFERDESGLNFGWCTAHKQWVKLYHPAGEWFSQCIFKGLRRYKDQELARGGVPRIAHDGTIVRAPRPRAHQQTGNEERAS
ncbi:MAG: hypothetical protein HYX29_00185 [Solirubrobacterales bacterium]|nr:hypothetical protein [Solirubrobacterales bacterium]